jgi:hypothetical protein
VRFSPGERAEIFAHFREKTPNPSRSRPKAGGVQESHIEDYTLNRIQLHRYEYLCAIISLVTEPLPFGTGREAQLPRYEQLLNGQN